METTRSRDGTQIAFDRQGSGTPLILVAGALSDRTSAAALAALLGSQFTVFSYDRRGRGDSGDTRPYSVPRELEDLSALLEVAGGKAFVFGHSSGAALALEGAVRALPMAKLAVYEPPFIIDGSREPLPATYTETLTSLLTSGRRGDAVEYFLTVAVQVPQAAVTGMRSSPMWPGMEKIAHTLLYDQAIMEGKMSGSGVPAGAWDSVGIPTLVIEGGASPAWMRNSAAALAKALPKGQHRSLPGQTHGADPAVLAPVLEAFFLG